MSSTAGRGPRSGRVLLIVLLVAGLVAALAWWWHGRAKEDVLSEWTADTGHPLTAEQRSVRFAAADLAFDVDPAKKALSGIATLRFDVLKPIDKLQLDLDPRFAISSLTADGKDARFDNPEGRLTVTLPRSYAAGEKLALRIAYAGQPHVAKKAPWDGGFVWSKTLAGAPWVATAVEGEGCDLFWPCIDNSLVEVGTVDLHITVPKGLVAPSNGRFTGLTRAADGRPTWNWRTSNPNNYAIALNIAPYKVLREEHRSRFGNVIPVFYFYLPGEDAKAKALFAEFGLTLDWYERTIGPYPFGSEKVAAVETPHLGMEHQTINAYGNGYKPAPEGFDWLFHHEFAHEWFGNQLTNADWDDMWLHEGFGTYMQALSIRDRLGDLPYDAWLWKQRALIQNKFPITTGHHMLEKQVYDDKIGPGTDIYYKGAYALHTLRNLIGDEPFFRATRRLVYGRPDPRPGNFTTRFGTTEEYVRLVNEETGRDLRWFFDVYIRSARLPRLVTTQAGNRVQLQWRTQGGRPFPMPVEVRVGDRVETVPMTGGRGTLTLPAVDTPFTIDPAGKLLMQSDAVDRFRDWTAEEARKKAV